MKHNMEKEITFEELTELVSKREQGICQGCGNNIVYPWIVRISNNFNYYQPDDYALVCGKCKQKAGKSFMKNRCG
jgi:hypothetical protein